tara:strand:- start:1891 stop:2253 length:363 start_codon:yes stop_codon:yes gene_type:complete
MAISYTWDVKTVDTYPSHTDDNSNTESDVIYNVHWRLTGEDDANNDADGSPQKGSVYGSINLDVSDLSSFTAFDSVTTSTVQGWVESALGSDEVTSLKSNIDAQIAEKVTPTTETKTIGS